MGGLGTKAKSNAIEILMLAMTPLGMAIGLGIPIAFFKDGGSEAFNALPDPEPLLTMLWHGVLRGITALDAGGSALLAFGRLL
jgi:hypothetical protein